MGKKKSQANKQKPTENGSAKPQATPENPPAEEKQAAKADEPQVNGTSTEEEPQTSPESYKEQGNLQFKTKNYNKAIDLYTKAISLNQSEPNFWNNRAAAYMAQNQFARALTDVQQAATLQSSSPQPKTLLRLSKCYFALGNVTGSINTLRTCLDADSNNAQALAMMKKVKQLEDHLKTFKDAQERKDWGVARLALDKCFQECEGPGDEEWKKWRVEMEIVKQRWDSAISLATEYLRASPQSPDLMYLRALVLFLTSSIPQAINHAQSTLKFDQEHIGARKLLKRLRGVERIKEEGNNAFKSGRTSDAVTKYTECLDAIGEKEEEGKGGQIRATLLSNRATALLKLNKPEDALEDTKACLVLSPDSFKALRTQARCYLALESYEEAVQAFKSALNSGTSLSADDERALKKELQKAEVLLKRSKTKDYYKILGLPKECAESDIKKAYRRESLKHHPDKGGDEEKFKLVVEAHAVLSDPQRRERYDMGIDEDGSMDSSGMGGMGGMGGVNMADILAAMAAQGGGFSFGGGPSFSSFGGGHSHGGHSHSHSHSGGFPF